jgi:hypothetical protein
MVRPVLLAVDGEPAARGSIEKELRKRYGVDHEVICEGSGAAALGALERVGATTEQLPVVVTFDGLVLRGPSFAEIAEALSAPTRPAAATYDVTVVGAGPAGPAAAMYGASEGLGTAPAGAGGDRRAGRDH